MVRDLEADRVVSWGEQGAPQSDPDILDRLPDKMGCKKSQFPGQGEKSPASIREGLFDEGQVDGVLAGLSLEGGQKVGTRYGRNRRLGFLCVGADMGCKDYPFTDIFRHKGVVLSHGFSVEDVEGSS